MKTRHLALTLPLIILLSMDVSARDTKQMFSVKDALNQPTANEKLNQGIAFYFGKQPHGEIVQKFGNYQSNKKTNAFGKSDLKACNWAFLSAMISLQNRAVAEGGNAVVNIQSFYKQNIVISETEFECGAGATMAGVTLTGDVVKLAE
jgi:uncharacterized protein YbjQ (UPF0145 family)